MDIWDGIIRHDLQVLTVTVVLQSEFLCILSMAMSVALAEHDCGDNGKHVSKDL